jgi:hypothetical protein
MTFWTAEVLIELQIPEITEFIEQYRGNWKEIR